MLIHHPRAEPEAHAHGLTVRLILLLMILVATLLGSLLALSYPKYTACHDPNDRAGGAGSLAAR